jgi:hypothetical protein
MIMSGLLDHERVTLLVLHIIICTPVYVGDQPGEKDVQTDK